MQVLGIPFYKAQDSFYFHLIFHLKEKVSASHRLMNKALVRGADLWTCADLSIKRCIQRSLGHWKIAPTKLFTPYAVALPLTDRRKWA